MTDTIPIVDCPRRQLYKTPQGVKILCTSLPIPEGISFKDLMANRHLYEQRTVTADVCEKCLNVNLAELRAYIATTQVITKKSHVPAVKFKVEADGSIVVEHHSGDWEPPRDIRGYERDDNDSWRFKSLWASCRYREMLTHRSASCGCVRIDMVCHQPDVKATDKRLSYRQCEKCTKRETGEPT